MTLNVSVPLAARSTLVLMALLLFHTTSIAAADPAIDPQAVARLKSGLDFLEKQQKFTVETENTFEVVTGEGQKIQYDNSTKLALHRPNKLRGQRKGDVIDQEFFYDGSSLTLFNPGENYYATVAAPDNLDAALDFARDELDIVAPAGDLLYSDAFEGMMENVTAGFLVGEAVVNGVRCDHLAFRAGAVDWQIWIAQGEQPLPYKLVITTLDVLNAPQFSMVMSNWDLHPVFTDEHFHFNPPENARQIEFLSAQIQSVD